MVVFSYIKGVSNPLRRHSALGCRSPVVYEQESGSEPTIENLLTQALRTVHKNGAIPGLICHSDRGSQYAAQAYRRQFAGMGARPPMSRTGSCYDNAPMERFFHTNKVELVHQRRWVTWDEVRRDLFAYIEGYYNRQRIHSGFGYLTPEQAERTASTSPFVRKIRGIS